MTKVIRNIGVIGEGKMGSSIFQYLNGFDFRLTWLCSSEQESVKAGKTIQKKLRFQFQNGIIQEKEFISKSENTKVTFLAGDLADCDLIIEAINEDIETKRMLFESLRKVINAECIITTNSSSYLPSQLIDSRAESARFAGMHFFFPVNMKKTVELIAGPLTTGETLESLDQFFPGINKKPFHQDESNAFVLNRLLVDYQAEAFNILGEGKLGVRDIDEIVKTRFFPIGVFEFFDHVGIDVMLSSIMSYTRNSTNRDFYRPLFQKLEEMAGLNHLGIKTRKGFYDYPLQQDGSSPDPEMNINLSEYKKVVANRLWDHYMKGVDSVLKSGICSREELGFYVKDYLGMDTDPFSIGFAP